MTDWKKLYEAQLQLTQSAIERADRAQRLAQPEPKPVAWEVWTIHNHIFFSIGVQSFQINDVLEHEPEVSAEEFSEWLATQLRHALTQLSNTAPPKKEWVGLTDDERIEISWGTDTNLQYAIAIEAKLKEKNNDR